MKSDTDMTKPDWIWFDLDDTLINFHANSRLALRLIYNECGIDRYYPTPEEWIATYETHNKELWDAYSRAEITQDFLRLDRFATPLRPHWTDSEDRLNEFSRALDPLYLDRLAAQTVMIEGAFELLAHLRAHDYNIGVLSNGFTDVQHRKLTNTGLDRMVDLMVLSDDIGVNKPDPRLYSHAMERSGNTNPGRHVMVGDNRATDIAGALASGWRAIWLNPHAAELSVETDSVIVTPKLSLLKELF